LRRASASGGGRASGSGGENDEEAAASVLDDVRLAWWDGDEFPLAEAMAFVANAEECFAFEHLVERCSVAAGFVVALPGFEAEEFGVEAGFLEEGGALDLVEVETTRIGDGCDGHEGTSRGFRPRAAGGVSSLYSLECDERVGRSSGVAGAVRG